LRRHVTLYRTSMTFRYAAKSEQRREVEVVDAQAAGAIRALLRRRGGGAELLAYRDGGRWRDVTSSDVSGYVKERLGDDVSAKDFRTWHAAAELALHDDQVTSRTAADRVVRDMVRTVADILGNTPAVALNSYIDPQVVECFRRGVTIDLRVTAERVLGHPATRSRAERATGRLLADA
jgi:DNA topoisomerase I